ncbi:MAG TPA: hypothetical protein VE957_23740 [Terriglobales bacterium]|nr:hypothetical protein [Terriglobales bacterium]
MKVRDIIKLLVVYEKKPILVGRLTFPTYREWGPPAEPGAKSAR